jgi:hypothetical protein
MSDWTIDLPGLSGKSYRYWRLDAPRDPAGILDVAGNYAFLKQLQNGNWLPVYIGQADSLRNRLPNHERWADAIRAGATLVVAHTTPAGEQVRLSEEQDLIAKWNPVLNVHHRTMG